jgi:hypothetical protein
MAFKVLESFVPILKKDEVPMFQKAVLLETDMLKLEAFK